jgi:alpha-glucosidase
MKYNCLLLTLTLSLFCFKMYSQNSAAVMSSPDGNIILKAAMKEKLEPFPSGMRLYFTVSYKGTSVIMDSPLGLEFNNMPPIARNLNIVSTEQRSINETWDRICGKSKKVINNCNEMIVKLEETTELHRKIDIYFRAYNDGIAFKYFLPEQPEFKDIELTSERSEFHFNWDFNIWAAISPGYITDQEFIFKNMNINNITAKNIVGQPVIIPTGSCYLAISESNVRNWAGMFLTAGSTQNSLVTRLSPRLDGSGLLAKATTPAYSPWRVVMIAEKPGNLLESDIIQNLSEPSEIKDPSWIKPGKCAWDSWWSCGYAPEVDYKMGSNTKSIKYYIDFAAEMGFPYMLVDEGWCNDYWSRPDLKSQSDITNSTKNVNMTEILSYAKQKKVRLLLWVSTESLKQQMAKAFDVYEKWGIAGVKVDFSMRDDQETLEFFYKTAQEAAKHHLLVDFHGSHIPTGITRTWPNVINSEGVYGNEHNKWGIDQLTTATHNVTIPFTRMLLGPMDYTPVAYRNVTLNNYKPNSDTTDGTFVVSTRCHQLAMMVVYESPLEVLADAPYSYRGQAGVDFIKLVPTNWDETKVLNGEIGNFITIARRDGNDWYIGSMNGSKQRTIEVSLSFLSEGKYTATIWCDTYETMDFPDRLRKEKIFVTKNDVLKIKMTSGGGEVVVLNKAFN